MRQLPVVAAVAALLASAPAAGAPGEPLARTHIDARIDVDGRRVTGRVAIAVANPTTGALDRAYLWLFPNRLGRRPPALTDVNFYWVYPNTFSPGAMRVAEVKAAGAPATTRVTAHEPAGEGTLLEISLPAAVPPGGELRLEARFETDVPERHGALGCSRDGCTLLGGFYPMLAGLDVDGWDLEGPPTRSRFTGALEIPPATEAVVAGARQLGPLAPIAGEGPYLPVVVAPALHESAATVRGVTVTVLSRHGPPPADDAARQVLPYTSEDYAGMIGRAAGEAIELLAEAGAPMPAGTRLLVVEAPLRLELAAAHPGMVVVSDHLYRIFPVERFRKFHERELVRALYTLYLARRLAADGRERARELGPAAETVASWLVDLYTLRRWHRSEFARDLLKPVSFVPVVDQMLYAPQMAFADAYFGNARADRFRDDVRRFNHLRPPGRLLYEKLRDLLGAEALTAAMRAETLGGTTLRQAAEAAWRAPLDWFFEQWQRPVPPVNYALGARRREPAPGGRWRHVIVVRRVVPAGAGPAPIEPVDVLVVDGNGRRHQLRWDGRGEQGEVALVTASRRLRSVEIDPRYRLSEDVPAESPDDARFDNRQPARLKFIYNSFGALFNLSDLEASLAVDFAFGRVHDTRNSFRLQVFRTEALTVSSTVSYTRSFGRKVTPSRLLHDWTLSLSLARLDPSYAQQDGEEGRAGTRVALGFGIDRDDRLFWSEPRDVRSWGVGARYLVTRFDGDGDLYHTGRAAFEVGRIFTPHDRHTLVGNLEGAAIVGEIVQASQLVPAGGPGLLRGYGVNALFGRARVTAHAEWRLALSHDLDVNVGHLAWLRGIGTAAFVDGGAVSGCDAYGDLLASRNLFASAGVGLRLFYDTLGVERGMLALDVAVPLVLRSRVCLGEEHTAGAGGLPVTVNLLFVPPF